MNFAVSEGSMVPASAPREILDTHYTQSLTKVTGGTFNAIKVIRMADRDRKMSNYAQKALEAFRELQRIELCINLPPNTEDRLYRIRLLAIQRMRASPLFLGHTREIGQAFDGEFNMQQGCYFCQGMTGWVSVKTAWTEEEKRTQLVSSDWKNRGQFAHACAEIMTSQQCAQNQVSRNRAWNW